MTRPSPSPRLWVWWVQPAGVVIAAGGVAEIPMSLDDLCKKMINKNLGKAIKLAIDEIDNYVKPISDLRGTSTYRKESLKGLFKRLKLCLEDDLKTLSVMEF